ncbi:MAG TPA: hypothetical protein VM843_00160 [Flavisolibacter sp.]|nr:hypothetical protein [Flavisolibacter sp.]
MRYFNLGQNAITWDEGYGFARDSLRVRLCAPRLRDTQIYIYPGRRFSSFFDSLNKTTALVLGRNEDGKANFIQMKAGEGFIYLHIAPLAFSNYFILHKNNVRYFQQALSVIPADIKKLAWNEYYLTKKDAPRESPPSMLRVLFQYEAFRWAFLVALGTMLLYVLLQMRRKQRIIPVLHKPKNESLDFVKTIGRLYYGQKNHKDLAQKMSTHFLDHVRNKYKVATTELDEAFIIALSAKSNYSTERIRELLEYVEQAFGDPSVSENQLAAFHQQLEKFYSTT